MAIAHFDLTAKTLNRGTRAAVLLPNDQPWYQKDPGPLKTLILLHGLTGDEDNWLYYTNIARLIREKPLCVIMPDGDNSFYADSPALAADYAAFIGEELIRFFRSALNLSPRREDTFIAGLSMGGFGAVNAALTYPDTFSHAAMYSSALIKGRLMASGREAGVNYFTRRQYLNLFSLDRAEDFEGCAADYEALARKLAASGKKRPRIYMTCGTEDGLYPPNAAFAALLKDLGYDVTWESRPGDHTWDFWEESLVRTFDWLPL